jgi:type IV secretory pathway VirB2 component (pilin)
MLTRHLAVALILGVVSTGCGWFFGLPFWGLLGLYILGGNIGLLASAALQAARDPLHAQPAALNEPRPQEI